MFLSFSNYVTPKGWVLICLSILNQLIWLVDLNLIIPVCKVDRGACMCCSIWWDNYYRYFILEQKFSPLSCGPRLNALISFYLSLLYPPLRNTGPLFSTCKLFSMGCIFVFCCLLWIWTPNSNFEVHLSDTSANFTCNSCWHV